MLGNCVTHPPTLSLQWRHVIASQITGKSFVQLFVQADNNNQNSALPEGGSLHKGPVMTKVFPCHHTPQPFPPTTPDVCYAMALHIWTLEVVACSHWCDSNKIYSRLCLCFYFISSCVLSSARHYVLVPISFKVDLIAHILIEPIKWSCLLRYE